MDKLVDDREPTLVNDGITVEIVRNLVEVDRIEWLNIPGDCPIEYHGFDDEKARQHECGQLLGRQTLGADPSELCHHRKSSVVISRVRDGFADCAEEARLVDYARAILAADRHAGFLSRSAPRQGLCYHWKPYFEPGDKAASAMASRLAGLLTDPTVPLPSLGFSKLIHPILRVHANGMHHHGMHPAQRPLLWHACPT